MHHRAILWSPYTRERQADGTLHTTGTTLHQQMRCKLYDVLWNHPPGSTVLEVEAYYVAHPRWGVATSPFPDGGWCHHWVGGGTSYSPSLGERDAHPRVLEASVTDAACAAPVPISPTIASSSLSPLTHIPRVAVSAPSPSLPPPPRNPTMKLLYFDLRGRAEMIRLALHAGGVDFEDVRFGRGEWSEIKPTTPRGSVPVLTLDDGTTTVTESVAILRYAGKLGTPRLYPEDPVAALRVDEMVDIIGSTTAILSKTFGLPSEEQLAMRTKILSEDGDLTKVLRHVDEAAKANSSGFLVGSELTIADCALRPAVYWLTAGVLDGIPKDCLDQYKGIAKVMQTMSEVPAIKRYEAEQYPA